jgi:hypothetical protein
MSAAEQLSGLEHNLSEVALVMFAPGSVDSVLQRIVDEATDAVEGCDLAGILLLQGTLVTTSASSDPLLIELHRLQTEFGEGPCLEVAAGEPNIYAVDLAVDDRWPQFGPAAVATGVRSVLAYQVASRRSSVLNLYSRLPAAFGAVDRAKALLFATLAGLALGAAEEHEDQAQREVQFQTGLRTRELIGQAVGILIERERITPDQAFHVLVRASQHLNVKLRDVAQTLVDTGETGDTPGRRRPQR